MISSRTSDPHKLLKVLEQAAHRRSGLWRSRGATKPTTAFRWLNGAGDGVEGLKLDVYGDWLVAHVYPNDVHQVDYDVLNPLSLLGYRGVYVKIHPKQANTVLDAQHAGLAPAEALFGESAPEALHVMERGIPFEVRLGSGLATGLYLDQRLTRERVQLLSAKKRVLNLFAYTCAFGVVAGLGEAEYVVNVDASKRALLWGQRNLELAGVPMERQRLIHEDVFDMLAKYRRQGHTFDLIVLDPPSYARTHRSRFSVHKDYPKMLRAVLSLLDRQGTLIACCNYEGKRLSVLKQEVHQVAKEVGLGAYTLRSLAPLPDFPTPRGKSPQLKVIELQRQSGKR